MKLSIVLPCYNVACHLEKCFESIYSQNVSYSFEVIAVNDASNDETLDKLMQLSTKYPNVLVVNKTKNEKLSGARSTGISKASGEYILHLDPDDYLLPNSLKHIFDHEGNWDILVLNIACQLSDKSQYYPLYRLKKQHFFTLSCKTDRYQLFQMIKGSCIGKVFRSSLCKDLVYSKYHYNIGEDFAFNFEVFNRAKNVLYVPDVAYCYQYNPTSLIRSAFNEARLEINNSWITNVITILSSSEPIYSESRKTILKEIERYSIGLLLKIKNEPEDRKIVLFNKWKSFFANQLMIYRPLKSKWYKSLLSVRSFNVSYVLFIMSLGQIAPITERIKRLFKIYN